MSDFSILSNPGTSIISSSLMPLSRPDPQSFLNNITRVSQSTEVTSSQGHDGWLSSGKRKFGNDQISFVNNLIKQSGCNKSAIKVARVWLDNQQKLEELRISRSSLAELSGVKKKTLYANISQLAIDSRLMEFPFSNEQQSLIDRIIDATGGRGNLTLTAAAWENNKDLLLKNKIDLRLFASRCRVNPHSLMCFISEKKRDWERLPENTRDQLEKLIKTAGCKGIADLASEVWYENKALFKKLRVSNKVFCFRTGVKTIAINTDLNMLDYVPPSKEPDFTPQQQEQIDKIIKATLCLRSPALAAYAWVDNQRLMSEMNIGQEAFANACKVNARHLFIKIQKERERTRPLTETQEKLLNSIAVTTDCQDSSAKSACAWLDNQQFLKKEGISQASFADFCRINLKTLGWSIARERQARKNPSPTQESFAEGIILKEKCRGKPSETALAWEKNKQSLLDAGLTVWQFERLSGVLIGTLSSRITPMYRQRNKDPDTPESRLLREKRLQEQQEVMDAIILRLDCKNKLINSKLAWVNNEQRFTALGISKAQFSRRCKINSQSLTSSVSRLIRNNGNHPPPASQSIPPAPPLIIKTESAANLGIMEITLDALGNELRATVRAEARLVDRPSIDNSLPILRHPDNPQHSLTLETLGLDAYAEVTQIKVTHWGSMWQVFTGLPVRKRETLKAELLKELHRQLMDEKGQSARMNRLMSNAGSHHLAATGDEIINLGMGVFNPGPAPVSANTVLGFYAGLLLDSAASQKTVRQIGTVNGHSHSWQTRTEKLNIDAFQSGNILRNINTGKLPAQPQLDENNVAAVQVNSRLIAYITTRDIAVGGEYFVDYGDHYNPLFGIEKARQEELAAGRQPKTEPEVLTATTIYGVNAFEPPVKRHRLESVHNVLDEAQ